MQGKSDKGLRKSQKKALFVQEWVSRSMQFETAEYEKTANQTKHHL